MLPQALIGRQVVVAATPQHTASHRQLSHASDTATGHTGSGGGKQRDRETRADLSVKAAVFPGSQRQAYLLLLLPSRLRRRCSVAADGKSNPDFVWGNVKKERNQLHNPRQSSLTVTSGPLSLHLSRSRGGEESHRGREREQEKRVAGVGETQEAAGVSSRFARF